MRKDTVNRLLTAIFITIMLVSWQNIPSRQSGQTWLKASPSNLPALGLITLVIGFTLSR